MAANVIIKILSKLVKKHGLAKGVKKAQKLGFSNKDIKAAVSQAGAKRKPRSTFAERKYSRRTEPSAEEFRAMFRKDRNDPRNWQTGQTGPAHEIYGIPGIDF